MSRGEIHSPGDGNHAPQQPSERSAAQGRPWWSYIPVVNVVILWAKYGWEGFE